ncbi:MAG: ABC transporter ATP-binding protein [Chloroflexi bacterium]|nr:ABC transporter ATP-binding protein [Chloroflexota bacterium]
MSPLLEIKDLVVDYVLEDKRVRAVDHVSFAIQPGEVVGLCGESGCGKSTAAHAILRILRPPAEIAGGQILFQGEDIVPLNAEQLRKFRWRHVSLVFQSAMNALNPVIDIGDQFADMIQAHEGVSERAARERAGAMLKMVGIDPSRLSAFPHELSGGMRQRVVIAMAMTLRPEMIVMDEPTTALDVVVQRQILQEIGDLQKELKFAVLFITHDLSMLIEFAHRIGVMYAGELVEIAKSQDLFHQPRHPYTVGLMSSFPPLAGPKKIMYGIPGSPPNLSNPPKGCRFYPRCRYHDPAKPRLFDRQINVKPPLREVEPGHWVACHLYDADLESERVHGLTTEVEERNPELPVLREEEVTHAG